MDLTPPLVPRKNFHSPSVILVKLPLPRTHVFCTLCNPPVLWQCLRSAWVWTCFALHSPNYQLYWLENLHLDICQHICRTSTRTAEAPGAQLLCWAPSGSIMLGPQGLNCVGAPIAFMQIFTILKNFNNLHCKFWKLGVLSRMEAAVHAPPVPMVVTPPDMRQTLLQPSHYLVSETCTSQELNFL